jgi:uncharacterized membrane protein YvlD (DUF360 family)
MNAWPTIRTYLVFALLALVAVLALSLMDPPYPHPSQAESLRLQAFVPVVALGCLGAWLFGNIGLAIQPQGWPAWRNRAAKDIAIGLAFGLVAALLDWTFGVSSLVAKELGVASIHMALPYSALAYLAGAVAVETLYRLIPISLAVWLVSKMRPHGRATITAFWIVAVLTSFIEPVSQTAFLASQPVTLLSLGLFIFIFNMTGAWLLMRHGVASPLFMRLAFYAVWHVALGPAIAST